MENPSRTHAPRESDPFVSLFAEAAAHACVFELKARLLAGVVPRLTRASVSDSLSVLVPKILTEVVDLASAEERKLIDVCARIRNRLLHLVLSRMTGHLVPLAEHLRQSQSVVGIDLETGATAKVRETSTESSGVFGWLLEAGQSGSFKEAARLFARGSETIDVIVERWTKRQMMDRTTGEGGGGAE